MVDQEKRHRVLLVGGGGREHALAWKLAASPRCERLVVAPGNPGIAAGAAPEQAPVECAAVAADDLDGLVALAARERLDLVVCGPEAALVAGLGDRFAAAGVTFFGPSAAAAEIEGSKAFAKELMVAAGVPTAAYGSFTDVAEAEAFIDRQPGDVVVKADGLCAGKGVVVTSSHDEARAAVRAMLADRQFGAAGARVVIEERLIGREVSMMALCDGERFVLLATAEDHKAVSDGDRGPNTGGMGAYSPSPLVDARLEARIAETIFAPTIRAMAARGRPFRGVLYGGLILARDRGPAVIEWNCRFGDPETQAVLIRLEEDLLPWLVSAAEGRLPSAPGAGLRWSRGVSVCVVMAAEGYPGKPRAGDPIEGLSADGQGPAELMSDADGRVMVFHAGTRGEGGDRPPDRNGTAGSRRFAPARLLTAGGRVLGVTALGADLAGARARAYRATAAIRWPGVHYRRDIGLRAR
jgi:phosphoribosylamine---glycine ligase